MMIDIVREIEAVQRDVGSGRIAAGDGRAIRLRRRYEAPIDDVWDALTTPERIARWFLPISGDYRVGGKYQLEGNAGGEILTCERPNKFRVTWVYGDVTDPASVSELEVRLAPAGEGSTTLELDHTAVVPDEMWAQYGPGAVGIGWDQACSGCRSIYGLARPWLIPLPGSCPRRDASSRPEAARRGAPRTRLRARTQRPLRTRSPTPRPSTRRSPKRRPEARATATDALVRITPGSP